LEAGGSIIKKTIKKPLAASRGASSNAKEILSQQAVGNYTRIEIKLTERHAAQAPALRERYPETLNGQFRRVRAMSL
jgi:hypothetical protein